MGHVVTFPADRHPEVQHLLPWYGTGQLAEDERAMVEAHLGECAECRADLEAEPMLKEALASASPDAETGWAALEARARRSMPAPRRANRPWSALGPRLMRPERLKWVVGAQFAALVVLSVAVLPTATSVPAERQGAYRTLGDAPAGRSGNVLAMFRPDASIAAMRHSLDASGARFVDGPTPAGAYVLDVPGGEKGRELAALRRDPNVTMAEPIEEAPPE
ncbi:MAG TPA: zf-HC2 domain-containing protein [Allosphingosinicella sp.]|nr:zf-HC2 domain-containing protein [Allosphingosinicella sp.]